MSNSSKPGFKNVPPPPGTKPASAYTRFIPREELGDFAAWSPDTFNGDLSEDGADAAPRTPPSETEWQAQIAAARQSGYQDGYRDGLVALDNFKQSYAGQLSVQLGQMLAEVDAQFLALEGELAQAVSHTAVRLARQLVRSELATDPAIVAQVAREALGAVLLSARQITLRINPHDLPLVGETLAETLQARGARVLPDASLERGGCRVESDLGAVDARIEQRWAQAAGALGVNLPWTDGDADA
jgi:flagellar assembly protein FliH